MRKGVLLVLSGPAGSGKGTVCGMLKDAGDVAVAVSATTRAPRPGEIDGASYYFLSREEFERRVAAGELVEYNEYAGNYYGTLKSEVERLLGEGKDLILEIDVNGGKNVKRLFPDAVLVMLLPPSAAIQEKRLRDRGTETEDKIRERLARTRQEVAELPLYDYVIRNRDGAAADAADDLRAVLRAARGENDPRVASLTTARHREIPTTYFAD